MCKDTVWQWGEKQEQVFQMLKQAFTLAPILAMADLTQPFIVECDASDYATGAVLSQKETDGKVHPIAFYS